MGAKYLLRFDDICPTLNWGVWEQVERGLIDAGIKPIVAIVPDNRDDSLVVQDANAGFWTRARKWQSQGWSIGWHGYQHVYDSAKAGLLGLNERSEFAGHPLEIQMARLRAAHEIFLANDVFPELWVAPGHSFDVVTVKALAVFGIGVISDGFYMHPVRDHGAIWLPQQLWGFRRMPFGLWMVCCHINEWTAEVARDFIKELMVFRESVISVKEARCLPCPTRNVVDSLCAEVYRRAILLRRAAKRRRVSKPRIGDDARDTGSET